MSAVAPSRSEKPPRGELEEALAPKELSAEELRFSVSLDGGFKSTAELAQVEDFVGQERAVAALELGLGVAGGGFNIFVSGLAGAEKLEGLRRWVAERASRSPTPGDWVYVHNFKYPGDRKSTRLNSSHSQ